MVGWLSGGLRGGELDGLNHGPMLGLAPVRVSCDFF